MNINNRYKTIQKERIVKFLARKGQMKVNRLARWADVTETSDTCPTTRGLIRELIDEGHIIGSNSNGYFLIDTAKEMQVYLNSLLKRQMGISKRIQAVYDAAQRKGII